jgi:dTDP-4-dehydrorhamnose reductase
MRVLVLGGNGMAGHMIVEYFKRKNAIELFFTTRNSNQDGIYVDVDNFEEVARVVQSVKPEVIINCVGILNDFAARNIPNAIKINSQLPHFLAELAERMDSKVIHISTDCVFSGQRGSYSEEDITDGTSIYAKTKALGELDTPNHLTIRTSIIGPELKENGIGLFHWFMNQTGTIKGFTKVLWNGVTTLELAKAIEKAIEQNTNGLYHLTAPSIISKYELLQLIRQIYRKEDVEILPEDTPVLDRTLRCTRNDLKYSVLDYPEMIRELYHWMSGNYES